MADKLHKAKKCTDILNSLHIVSLLISVFSKKLFTQKRVRPVINIWKPKMFELCGRKENLMEYSNRLRIFEQVWERYTPLLSSILWKLTSDKEIFVEALQYALLEMWRHADKLNGPKAVAYIYRIALSANSKAWRNRIGKDGQLEEHQTIIDTDKGQKDDAESLVAVRQAIAELPAKQAKAIVLRYIEQQSYESIAGQLNCSPDGARSNVSKALATLKTKLAHLTEGGQ
jgi:RNA polymerase sigma factor (sigma-70 family)